MRDSFGVDTKISFENVMWMKLPFPPVELEIPEDDSPESEPEVIPTTEVTPADPN